METFGMILFILFALASVGLFAYQVVRTRGIVKNPINNVDYKNELKKSFLFNLGFSLAFTFMLLSIYLWGKIAPKWYELLFTIVCGSSFALAISTFYVTFRIHYYRKNLPKNVDKLLFRLLCISIPVFIICLWYTFNGFTEYMTYPIVNGISFSTGWTFPNKPGDGMKIAWYALCILGGALFVYFLCDHKMYQQYGKHGTLESTFLVAFPAGIIGARIWYVIGNWTKDGFDKNFASIFAIWDGGLTILGGAIMGILVGVLWFIWRNKKLSIWVAVDMIVPTILLAQAIGRIGNFFNCEVHGGLVETKFWEWLPQIIVKNGAFSTSDGFAPDGYFYLPLFFIESVLNVGGYFILSTLFGKALRKYTEMGDLAFGYVLVYGLIRVWLEPLRSASYNMGEDGYWSWIFSGLFILFGALGIVGNHVVRYFLRKKKNTQKASENWAKNSKITLIVLLATGALMLIGAISLMASDSYSMTLVYNRFNIGVILLIMAVSTLTIAVMPLIYLLEIKNKPTESHEA